MSENYQKKIKVLIVDDSFFMKKLLRDLFANDLQIEVVGEAKDGAEAVGEAIRLKPDIITMDYHLPKMNGAEAIREILRNSRINPPAIIMLSAYAKDSTKETIECLDAGAIDFIAKPSGEVSLDIDKIKDDLLAKIHNASRSKIKCQFKNVFKKESQELQKAKTEDKIVVIGSSTGGPLLVEQIISELPEKINFSVVIAQHMPAFFIPLFAKRLSKLCSIEVVEPTEGQVLEKGKIYVLPADKFSLVKFNKNSLSAYFSFSEIIDYIGPRPPINCFLSSSALFYKKNCLAVILTGMGDDGLDGAREVKNQGGKVLAQDPKTAVVSSMPDEVINANLADRIVAPKEIVKAIKELII
jgi:two-component system chemotaxis response regulator CheB